MSGNEPVAPAEIDEGADFAAFEQEQVPTESGTEHRDENAPHDSGNGPESQSGNDDRELEGVSDSNKPNIRALRQKAKQYELENGDLKQRLEALERRIAERPADKKPETPVQSGQGFTKPRPNLRTFEGSAEDYEKAVEDWIKERDDHIRTEAALQADEKIKRQQIDAQKAEWEKTQATREREIAERARAERAELSVEFEDFEETVSSVGVKGANSEHVRDWLRDTSGAQRVWYHLCKNPEESAKIFESDLTKYQQIASLETLRTSLSGTAPEQQPVKGPPKRVTPPKRVSGGQSVPSNKPEDTDPDDYLEFERRMRNSG